MTQGLRAEAMGRRLLRTAGRLGIAEAGRQAMMLAFEVGMEPRLARALDDHHPDYLHPARTALILMDDAGVDDPVTLAAALITETRDRSLAAEPARVAELGPAVVAVAAEIPEPHTAGDRLLEILVAAPAAVRLVAVAERLDHARHLHLRPEPEWAGYHATTCGAYTPVAQRTDPQLAGRLGWWCTTFQQRFLGS
jgi:(p)ppGpp synthase/HD superfamily hydrolase